MPITLQESYLALLVTSRVTNWLQEQGFPPVRRESTAEYLARRFGVLHHEPTQFFSGYSGTLFARRAAPGSTSVSSDSTLAIEGTNLLADPIADIESTELLQMGLLGAAVWQKRHALEQWNGLMTGAPDYPLSVLNAATTRLFHLLDRYILR